ncbi:MAG: hypothetical protein MK105_06825 [Crocinitomicaceae bacterium]|nr:hypothetical protein [Crocinitomicaceae bacterium]
MRICKFFFLISILSFGFSFAQNDSNIKQIEMYATLVDTNHGFTDCGYDTVGGTFIFKVILASDSSIIPGTRFAVAVMCSEDMENELLLEESYNLMLSNEEYFNGLYVKGILPDQGRLIRKQNNSKNIYWVKRYNRINNAFVRMAETKLGIAEFPMEKLNTDIPLSSMYGVVSHEDKGTVDYLPYKLSISKRISNEDYLKPDEIGIYVDTTTKGYFNDRYEGYKMYVYNNTQDTALLPSTDTRLFLVAQAQDKDGIWRDFLEPLRSTCAYSYHPVQLYPRNQWTLVAPFPSGEHPTKVRMKLDFYYEGEILRT